MSRTLKRGATLVLALLPLLAGCASLSGPAGATCWENSLVFHPRPFPKKDPPDESGLENVWFHSADGTRLHGWYAEAAQPAAVVLYAHGNSGNIAGWRWVVDLFRDQLNASVMVFDYRGFGRSAGRPSEAGVLADARAARRWLAGRTGVNEADIVLVGRSLGGGVMVDLAAKDGARALVLENTFTSLPDVAQSYVRFLPFHWMMRTRFDSVAHISAYRGPLLQTHGTADRVVPFALGKQLHQAANEPKQFVTVPNGGHNDPLTQEYVGALRQFLHALPPRPTIGQPQLAAP